MALIVCPECEKQISDQAEMCPNCGYPIGKQPVEGVEESASLSPEFSESENEIPDSQRIEPINVQKIF